MECIVDRELLERAQRVLGTSSPEETVEVSLRRVLDHTGGGTQPLRKRVSTVAEWEELRERLRKPPTEAELEQRRRSAEAADRLRVSVGRDFNIAEIVRELRDQAAEGIHEEYGNA